MKTQSRIRPWMIGTLALLVIAGIAWAVKPFRADAGLQTASQSSWTGLTGVPGAYYKTGSGWMSRHPDNTEVSMEAGGLTWPLENGTSTNTYTSGVADSSSAVGHSFRTSNAFSTAGDKLVSFGDTAEKLYLNNSGTWIGANAGFQNSGGYGAFLSGNNLEIYANGLYYFIGGAAINTGSDNQALVGQDGARMKGFMGLWHDTKLGAQLTAASTITPTTGLHHVTGATTITIIANSNLPTNGNPRFCAIADSTLNWGTSASAGGISTAPAATSTGRVQCFEYDSATALWYAH
jgi:hypothetical protein